MNKSAKIITSLVGIAVLGGVAYFGYKMYQKNKTKSLAPNSPNTDTSTLPMAPMVAYTPVSSPNIAPSYTTPTITSQNNQSTNNTISLNSNTLQTIAPKLNTNLNTNLAYSTPTIKVIPLTTSTVPKVVAPTCNRYEILDQYQFTSEEAKQKFLACTLPLDSYCTYESVADSFGWSSVGNVNDEKGCV